MKLKPLSKTFVKIAPFPWMGGHLGASSFVFLALFCVVLSVAYPQSAGGLRTKASDMMSPVIGVLSRPLQDATGFVRAVTGIAGLQAENARLREENAHLREWYQTAMVLKAENASLRELMKVRLEPQARYVTARIISDSSGAFMKSMIVSAGKNQKVDKGQAVISGEGVVGRVVEAGNETARVLLITDINSRVPVLIENSSLNAIMAGNNDARPELIHLPPDIKIENGARVITSGVGGMFPYGLPVGVIAYDKAGVPRVEPFADFSNMVFVRAVKLPEDPNLRSPAELP